MKPSFRIAYITFSISLVILIALSLLFYERFQTLRQSSSSVEHTYKVISTLNKLELALKDAETGQRGYLLTGDSSFLNPESMNMKAIRQITDSLRLQIADNTSQELRLVVLLLHISDRLNRLRINTGFGRSVGADTLHTYLLQGKQIMDSVRSQIHTMIAAETGLLSEQQRLQAYYENITPAYFSGIFLFSLVIFIISFFIIRSELKRRVRNQRELESKNLALMVSNQEMEQLTFIASHDLQEPLRKIRTFTDILVRKHSNELTTEAHDILNRMDQSAFRMQSLIESLVNYSSIVNSGEKITRVNLSAVISAARDDLQSELNSKKGMININSELAYINGFQIQLHLLFRALLDNAIKFSMDDVPPVVNIYAEPVAGAELQRAPEEIFYKISIADNGIGFEQEFAEKIFAIFQQLHHRSSNYKGNGLGLAMAKRIMSNHHGFITVRSTKGAGTTFTLYFPS